MKTTGLRVKQTKAGQDYHVFELENGKYLSVFKWDARFSEIQVGTDIPESVLEYDQQYDNYKLKPLPKGPQIKAAGGGYKSVQIEKVMDKKAGQIEEAQERKNKAIHLAGAMRDATLTTLQSLKDQPFPTDEEYKAEWRKWVKFYLNESEQPFI